MLIDWFTIIAQIINFLILVWLLKRFLYKPILNAMDAREKMIAAQLTEAQKKMAETEQERRVFKDKNEEFDREKDAMLKQAAQKAEELGKRLNQDARDEINQLQARWHAALRQEKDTFKRELIIRAQKEVFVLAGRTLEDLAGCQLEERMAHIFIQRLKEMDKDEKTRTITIIKSSHAPMVIKSAFNLSKSLRQEVETAIQEVFATDIHTSFEISPDLVSGIELYTEEHKISWNIAEYLSSLENNMGKILDRTAINESA